MISSRPPSPSAWAGYFTSFLFVWSYWLIPYHFHINDDIGIILISNGGYSGEASHNLVFMSSLLGRAFVALYQVFPDINWYSFVLFACNFASIFLIELRLFKYLRGNPVLMAAAILLSLLFSPFLISNVTFTIAGFLAGFSALIVLFTGTFSAGNFKTSLFPGLWLGLSFLIREESFLGVCLLAAPLWILPLVKDFKRFLAFSLGAAVLIGAGLASDYFAYRSPQWQAFLTQSDALYKLNKPLPVPEDFPEIIKRTGWSENDLAILVKHWWTLNEEKYSAQKFENAAEAIRGHRAQQFRAPPGEWLAQAKKIRDTLPAYVDASLFLFLTLCVLNFGRWARVAIQSGLLLAISAVSLYTQMFVKFPERIAIPFFLFYCCTAMVLHVYPGTNNRDSKRWTVYIASFLIAAAAFSTVPKFLDFAQIKTTFVNNRRADFERIMGSLNRLPEDSVLIMMWTFPYEAFPVFSRVHFKKPSSILFIGWPVQSPLFFAPLRQIGFSSGRDFEQRLTQLPRLYLFATKDFFELFRNYMKENFGATLTQEMLEEFDPRNGELSRIVLKM